jgi:hypothetical protein
MEMNDARKAFKAALQEERTWAAEQWRNDDFRVDSSARFRQIEQAFLERWAKDDTNTEPILRIADDIMAWADFRQREQALLERAAVDHDYDMTVPAQWVPKRVYDLIIWAACQALQSADYGGLDPRRLPESVLRRERRSHLARCAEDLARYFREGLGLYEDEQDWPERIEHCETWAAEFHELNSHIGAPDAIRQSHGKKFTHAENVFLANLTAEMCRWFERPYHEAVAAIASIAFDRDDVTSIDVQNAYRRRPGRLGM